MHLPLLATALLMPCLALASGKPTEKHDGTVYLPNAAMTYEVFEATIAHADLERCPLEFDSNVVFCRIAMANEQAHVFVFGHAGESPLMAVKSYELGDGFLPF